MKWPRVFSKKSMSKGNGVPERGQAILEYTLLLIIVLTILGGVIYQFNDAFRVYAGKLFVGEDSYVGCLIKNGLLPGGDSDTCPPPKFNMADGKPKTLTPGAGGSGAGGNGKSGTAAATSSGGRRANERSSNIIAFNSADNKNAGGIGTADAGKNGKGKTSTGNDGFSSSSTNGSGGSDGEVSTGNDFRGRRRAPIVTDNSTKEKAAATVPMTDRDMKSARDIAQAKKKKAADAEDADRENFSFSNIFKYLIIAALIFSIIFFVGSQFLAVSRSKRRK